MLQLDACSSERALAENTATMVKQSLEGAGFAILTALPIPGLEEYGAAGLSASIAEGSEAAADASETGSADASNAGDGGGDWNGDPSCPTPGGSSFTAATMVLLASAVATGRSK